MQKLITITLTTLCILTIQWCFLDQDNTQNTIKDSQTNNIENNTHNENSNKITNKIHTYESKLENFSFDFPVEWTIKEDNFNIKIFTPRNDDINENIVIVTQQLQKFLSVDEYYEETIQQFKDTLEWFQEIESKDIIKWKLKWKTIVYKHTIKDKNLTLKSSQTFLMWPENRVYSINYTATKDSFDTHIKWHELIINSFILKQ